MSETAVVTDSTAYLPDELVEENGIGLVRLQVIVAGRSYQEGTEIHPAQVAEALREWKVITTSRPTPAEFLTAYTAAAEAGATGVVSVHLSAHMSGTYESAMFAARESPIPVRVIDSRSVGMGLGFVAGGRPVGAQWRCLPNGGGCSGYPPVRRCCSTSTRWSSFGAVGGSVVPQRHWVQL
jgi:fatty acid-binding protein DegV